MNIGIEQLVRDLKSDDLEVFSASVNALKFFVEKYYFPEKEDELWVNYLNNELLALEPSHTEINELLNAVFLAIEDSNARLDRQVVMFTNICQYCSGEQLVKTVGFLCDKLSQTKESQAYSCLAALLMILMRTLEFDGPAILLKSLKDTNLVLSLKSLDQSQRVKESACRSNMFLHKIGIS